MTESLGSETRTVPMDVNVFYKGGLIREISNSTLNKVKTRYGVTITPGETPGTFLIGPDENYEASRPKEAIEVMRRMHLALDGARSKSVNTILNKTITQDILKSVGGEVLRKSNTGNPDPKTDFEKSAGTPKAARMARSKPSVSSNKEIIFNDTPYLVINTFQGRSLADIHDYLSKQRRAVFLEEFERKMGIRVELNKELGFDVLLPRNHEGPLNTQLSSAIEIALMNLQTLREGTVKVDRNTVKNEVNKAMSGRLTPLFAAIAAEKATTVVKAAALPGEITFQTFNAVSEGGKKAIKKIVLPVVEGRSENQKTLITNMRKSEIGFAVAPAGTGKTFLACYILAEMLTKGIVDSLVITRPAIEAGERLGFMPGDAQDKMDHYLKPIYRCLVKVLAGGDLIKGKSLLRELMETGVIEISPLAFMRGDEFERKGVLLDEAQNATEGQLKMFLSRIGQGGRIFAVGDPEQTDLKPHTLSVFIHMARIFEKAGVEDITTSWMEEKDAVRHPKLPTILRILRENPVPSSFDPYRYAAQLNAERAGTPSPQALPAPNP